MIIITPNILPPLEIPNNNMQPPYAYFDHSSTHSNINHNDKCRYHPHKKRDRLYVVFIFLTSE